MQRPRRLSNLAQKLALGVSIAALIAVVSVAPTSSSTPASAASTVAGTLVVPRPSGLTVGFAGTNDPAQLAAAQPFGVASISMFHVPTQNWSVYVPGAPAFANTLNELTLRAGTIVFVKRTEEVQLTGTATAIAGAPLIEIPELPQRFPIPPDDGLTLGVSGTTDPAVLADVQFFVPKTLSVWSVPLQRYLTYIPGAPAIVNSLTAANLQASDFVWVKVDGGATGGMLLEDMPFLARLVPFGAATTLLSVGTPLHGTLIENGDGTVTYVPEENFHGEDSFTYTVMTENGPELRTFRLEVQPENDPPIANDDAAVAEDGGPAVIAVLDNDEDPDDDPLEIIRTTQPANGIVAIAGNSIIYTPNPKFVGVDTFEYEISDGIADPGEEDSIATVFVAVGGAKLAGPPPAGGGGGGTPPPDGGEPPAPPPFLSDDSAHLETCEAPLAIDVLSNDAGDGVTELVISTVSTPALGSAADNGDGTVTYTPPEDCTGSDSFTYSVPDAEGVEQTASVSVTLGEAGEGEGGENQVPEALDDTAATFGDDPISINVIGNDSDPDGDPLTVIDVTQPSGGSVTDNGDGTVTYVANGFSGQTSFGYTISDGNGGEASANVSVDVEAAPVAPVGPVVVSAGGQVTIQVVSPSTFVQLSSAAGGSHGSVSMDAGAGTVTYSADAGYEGTDWISWVLLFSHGGTAETTLQMEVVN